MCSHIPHPPYTHIHIHLPPLPPPSVCPSQSCVNQLGSTCTFGDCTSGQNAYMTWNSAPGSAAPTVCDAVTAWYNEVKDYAFTPTPYSDNKANFDAIGHFTQLVWGASTSMGCATASSGCNGNANWYIVCDYSPAGNVVGDASFLANVKPRSQ